MKTLSAFGLVLGCVLAAASTQAIDLKQSKLTQVVNDVQIISAADQKQKPALVNDVFAMPDILRTGAASRAELVAQDQTVTRVGANTIFSFDPGNRSFDLQQGSLLFHAPHGKGGGTIHTGAATASVLGTTLIVTTVANGGFKVIALEGRVEVKFLNGLRQKLDPGQMTFVLPGANQLAPIIIFRLDELVNNSLLVLGFANPLASLPLIQQQIAKQLKQIRSGQLSDTGWYAGDNAWPDQVEVLDINTVSHLQQTTPTTPNPAPAESADATINQPSLTDASVPTPPNHIFLTPFTLPGNYFFAQRDFTGFLARNIYLNTLGVQSDNEDTPGLVVDLSRYAGSGTFDLVAQGNVAIPGSVTFAGLAAGDNFTLAGNEFTLSPGVTVSASANNFLLESVASLSLDSVTVVNSQNNLALTSAGSITCQASTLGAPGNLTLNANGDLNVQGGSQLLGNTALLRSLSGSLLFDSSTLTVNGVALFFAPTAINVNNSQITCDSLALTSAGAASIGVQSSTLNTVSSLSLTATTDLTITGSTLNADPNSGSINLASTQGSVTATGITFTANTLKVSAADSITFDGPTSTQPTSDAKKGTSHYLNLESGDLLSPHGKNLANDAIAIPTASFTAANNIQITDVDLSGFGVVSMAAHTIVLTRVGFSTAGIYNFMTANGTISTGQNPGGLQLLNCTLNNVLLTLDNEFVHSGSSAPGTTPGIYCSVLR